MIDFLDRIDWMYKSEERRNSFSSAWTITECNNNVIQLRGNDVMALSEVSMAIELFKSYDRRLLYRAIAMEYSTQTDS